MRSWKILKRLSLLLAVALLLTACGGGEEQPGEGPGPLALTVCLPEVQDTLDPARVTAQGGEMLIQHLYENLLRWEDGGAGWAAAAPGQAESWEVETDFAGNATYTFTLREDILWSDGRAVTADDFVTAWRRLADPANDLPHRELLEVVSGYAEVQESGDVSLLAVSAPDSRTFTVALNGSCAWFLEELCAGSWTMPVRTENAGRVTNGPYTVSQSDRSEIALMRNENYYDKDRQGPDTLRFLLSEGAEKDYERFQAGERGLVTGLPAAVLQELPESWMPEPVTGLTAILINTRQAPFDSASVRLAFRLAVDAAAVVQALDDPLVRPASGVVPYGVADYGERPVMEEPKEEESALPDPNAAPAAAPEEPVEPFWDFRTHSLRKVTAQTEADYATACQQARQMLSAAGYPGGEGFPEVEYIYVNSPAGRTIAAALQSMWQEQLGVKITPVGLSQEDYEARMAAAIPAEDEEAEEDGESGGESEEEPAVPFSLAAQDISAAYSDAGAVLERWHSQRGDNFSNYHSDAFDILLDSARAAVSPDARDAYLHDAEAILLEEAPVIPVCYQGGSYLLAEGLEGLFRGPDGVYFLCNVTRAEKPAA